MFTFATDLTQQLDHDEHDSEPLFELESPIVFGLELQWLGDLIESNVLVDTFLYVELRIVLGLGLLCEWDGWVLIYLFIKFLFLPS